MKFTILDYTLVAVIVALLVALILLDTSEANAADHAIDSTMTLVNCRDVPDSLVKRGLDHGDYVIMDEWGEFERVIPGDTCVCPEGTRKKYSLSINASDPPSQWVECWTVKTVCDTVWTKEE